MASSSTTRAVSCKKTALGTAGRGAFGKTSKTPSRALDVTSRPGTATSRRRAAAARLQPVLPGLRRAPADVARADRARGAPLHDCILCSCSPAFLHLCSNPYATFLRRISDPLLPPQLFSSIIPILRDSERDLYSAQTCSKQLARPNLPALLVLPPSSGEPAIHIYLTNPHIYI